MSDPGAAPPFETRLKVRFGDVDQAGIVYYPVILHYCHVCFEEFFEHALRLPYPRMVHARHLGMPTVSLQTSFDRPFRYGMDVRGGVAITRLGNSSVTFEFTFRDAADGALLARSTNVTVMVDMRDLRPVPVPDDLRPRFAAHLRPGGAEEAPR